MSSRVRVIAVAAASAVAGAAMVTASATPLQTAGAADIARGKQAYSADGCYQCHGRQGQGGRGPALAATALPYEAFAAYVRAPGGNMPPYGERVLTDASMGDIYAFVKQLPGPDDPLPALQQR